MGICNILRSDFFLIFCVKVLIVEATTCYWPNGAEAQSSDGIQACNATVNGADSGCCSYKDVCTTKGFCFSSTVGFMYRGGCTDQAWNLDVLPRMSRRRYSVKVSCLIRGVANVREAHNDGFVNIFPCPTVNGTSTTSFCCNNGWNNTCCDKTFDWGAVGKGAGFFIPHGDIFFLPNGDNSSSASAAPLSSEANSSPTSSHPLPLNVNSISNSTSSLSSATTALTANESLILATSSCKSLPQSNDYVALGAEIGVPLGVLLLLALSFLLLMEHRRRKSSEKTLNWIHVRDKSKEKAMARGRRNPRLNNHTTVFELGNGEVYETTGHSPPTGHERVVAI